MTRMEMINGLMTIVGEMMERGIRVEICQIVIYYRTVLFRLESTIPSRPKQTDWSSIIGYSRGIYIDSSWLPFSADGVYYPRHIMGEVTVLDVCEGEVKQHQRGNICYSPEDWVERVVTVMLEDSNGVAFSISGSKRI